MRARRAKSSDGRFELNSPAIMAMMVDEMDSQNERMQIFHDGLCSGLEKREGVS